MVEMQRLKMSARCPEPFFVAFPLIVANSVKGEVLLASEARKPPDSRTFENFVSLQESGSLGPPARKD